jgi:hypothetical protein
MVNRKYTDKFNLRMSDDERDMLKYLTQQQGLSSDAATVKRLIRLAYREMKEQESVRTNTTVSTRKKK